MELITCALAERLETAEAADGAACAEAEWVLTPHSNVAVKSIAGGFLLYLGTTSPLTHALGIGMHGCVTEEHLDEIEEFYRSRDCLITIDLCPFAHPTLRELLTRRNYRLHEFANVLVRRLHAEEQIAEPVPPIEVHPASPIEIETWSDTVVRGFFSREQLSAEEMHLGRILFSMTDTEGYLATVAEEPAGGGAMSLRRGVASFFADAVLPPFRRRGVHNALIQARLAHATAAGCDLATAGTQPGSSSQLNYQRNGFQIAYTKATMVSE